MRRASVVVVLLVAIPLGAQQPPQLRLPRASPKASITQTVGLTGVTITYSRPGVKGRQSWGGFVCTAGDWAGAIKTCELALSRLTGQDSKDFAREIRTHIDSWKR